MTDQKIDAVAVVDKFLNDAVASVRGPQSLAYCANVYGAWEFIKGQLMTHTHVEAQKPDAEAQ